MRQDKHILVLSNEVGGRDTIGKMISKQRKYTQNRKDNEKNRNNRK